VRDDLACFLLSDVDHEMPLTLLFALSIGKQMLAGAGGNADGTGSARTQLRSRLRP
jgi:hypothetical protein